MNRSGLNHGTAGNVSIRTENGFLITPSAMAYADCTADDMVAMCMADMSDMSDMSDMAGIPEGSRKPSSEWRLHRDIYCRHSGSNAILHVHSPWCTTLACLEKQIPPFHYMVAMAGGDHIPCSPYAPFGSQQLSDTVLQTMGDLQACLMGHHGMICHTPYPDKLLSLALEVEMLARVYAQALQIASPPLLSKDEMGEALQRFTSYRP